MFRPSQARVSAERLRLPGGERLGLVGTAYTVELGQGLAFGPAVFGSVSGNRGGLFTLGAELAWRARLWGPLRTELGVYAGGGGGAALPVGDGLMLRPHADLLYDFGGISLGLSWSQVRFAGTPISSRQVGLVLSTDTDFTYLPRDRQGLALPSIGTGLRAERALRGPFYWGLEANVGTQGGVTGYVEYLGTVGVEAGLPDSVFSVGGRVALGMAGGGDIAVGGGLLAKASAYGAVRLTRDLAATVEFGLTSAPRGDFRALHGAASLIWIFDDAGNVFSPSRTTRTEFATGLERIDAARRDGSTRPLTTVVLKASRFLDANLYVTGQARSAVGGGAGGWHTAPLRSPAPPRAPWPWTRSCCRSPPN
ncbi:hypothetical protein ABXN37_19380 [Piscinibacter sakaiensis]|uniref:hypothetical protein n=1 Tax=Piscinibacter sakaiensis TaxID=1547922 RepID=UPI00372BED60